MIRITLPADRAVIDMAAVAQAFGISVKDLDDAIHIGTISRWLEVGGGDQDNKPHQIFASVTLGLRVDVDEHGAVHSADKYDVMSVLQTHQAENRRAGQSKPLMKKAFDTRRQSSPDTMRRAHLDALLDEAVDESFPASDPIAISFMPPNRAARF